MAKSDAPGHLTAFELQQILRQGRPVPFGTAARMVAQIEDKAGPAPNLPEQDAAAAQLKAEAKAAAERAAAEKAKAGAPPRRAPPKAKALPEPVKRAPPKSKAAAPAPAPRAPAPKAPEKTPENGDKA